MKTIEEIESSSALFDDTAISGLNRKANPKFWYQFIRYGERLTRFSDRLSVHSNEHDPVVGIRDGFYWAIKKSRALSIVETYYTADVNHYLISCPSRLRQPRISRVTDAGFVLSIASGNECAALPFVSRLPGDVLPRWFRVFYHAMTTLLGLPFVAVAAVLIGAMIGAIHLDSRQLYFFVLGLPMTLVALVGGLIGLKGEYIAFKRGLSPVEAELLDATNAAKELLDSLSSAENSKRPSA